MILLAGLPFGAIAQQSDIDQIRALRTQSNLAIVAHNLDGFGQTLLPDVVVTRGSGTHVAGRDSVLASLAVQFKDPNFMGYVRETDSVTISTSNPLAAEHGHWTGRFRQPDGIQIVKGVYLSMWRQTNAGWKIRSELFVTLSCTGSKACTGK